MEVLSVKDYKISLEISNDPSGEIRSISYPLISDGYEANIERAAEFYDFYRECFHEPLRSHPTGYPHPMSWPGLARLAGSQVIGGLSDSEWGRKSLLPGSALAAPILGVLSPFLQDWTENEIEQLQIALFQGGWQIFTSVSVVRSTLKRGVLRRVYRCHRLKIYDTYEVRQFSALLFRCGL
jgi:hypothetical protein